MYRKLWAIPDIHGREDLLDLVLEKIDAGGFDKSQDKIVFLGDYIDRGPNSKEVIETIKRMCDDGEAVAVRGNHESFAIDYYTNSGQRDAKEAWMYNGGYNTLSSYGNGPLGRMTDEHVRFIGSLPTKLVIDGFFFSHAPVPREKTRHKEKQGKDYDLWELTWNYFGVEGERPGALMEAHEGPLHEGQNLFGVCGHIHRGPSVTEVRLFPKYAMLDCGAGCFPTGSLSAYECYSKLALYAKPEEL